MLIHSKQIKGLGRGKEIGFPTINLAIPDHFVLEDGIYGVWVVIDDISYKGALHYGPIPTFNQEKKSMEVHLIDIDDHTFPDTEGKTIEIDIVERIRDIKNFQNIEDLFIQISQDIDKIRNMLKL